LAGRIENLLYQWLAVCVFIGHDVAADFDQVTVEVALVPLGENFVHLVGAHAKQLFHDLVGFAD